MEDEKKHDEIVAKQFFTSGIPSRYHNRKMLLSEMKTRNADALSSWFSSGITKDMAKGSTFEWVGDYPDSFEEFYMTARGLTICGVGVYCISLIRLVDILTGQSNEDSSYLKSCKVLMITGFTCDTREKPLLDQVSYRVEWFIRDWLYANKSLVLLNGIGMEKSAMWSKGFVSLFRKQQVNKFINVSRS